MVEKKVIYPVLTRFFDCYLKERNIAKTLSIVADDLYSLGTGDEETATNKEEFARLLEEDIKSIPDPIQYKIMDYQEKQTGENSWECLCKVETAVRLNGSEEEIRYLTRFTGGFRRVGEEFLATALHMSEASSYQESGEFFPLRFFSEKTEKLNETAQHELLDIICQMMPGGVIGGYIEDGFPLYVVNDTMLEMMGYTYNEFVEETEGLVINSIHEDDAHMVEKHVLDCLKQEKQYAIEYRVKKKDGSSLWVYDIGRKIIAEDGRSAIISVLVDISESVRVKKNLIEESNRDFLTGIYNRKGGEATVTAKMNNSDAPYIFLMIDLDNFKSVNDMYGHGTGDKMLRFFAKQLRETFRKTDIVIRLGGDEFAVYAQPCFNKEAIQNKVEKIIKDYVEEAKNRCPSVSTSVSVGGIYSMEPRSFSSIYKAADGILYEIKQSGKGRCEIREI